MTMLHEYAQQIVRDRGAIQLPDFEASVYPRNPKNNIEPLEVNRTGYLASAHPETPIFSQFSLSLATGVELSALKSWKTTK